MGDNLKHVRTGDPLRIAAGTFNTFIDAARAMKARQHDGGRGQAALRVEQAGIVCIEPNLNVDRYQVLGVNAPLFPDEHDIGGLRDHIAISGVSPTAAHAGRFVITIEPIADGAIGRAVASGIVRVKINVSADADARGYEYADVTPDSVAALTLAATGAAHVLWRAGGVGQQWAVVRLSNRPLTGVVDGPYTMLPESRGVATAQEDTWERDDPPEGTKGVYWQGPRIVWDNSNPLWPRWYEYSRMMVFDSAGLLVSISAETEREIIQPRNCTEVS